MAWTIDEYIVRFPKGTQRVLEQLRQTIHNAVPDAEEAISYQIPTFKLNGRAVIYFAAWRHHIAIYPIPRDRNLRRELRQYIAGRGTIKFPFDRRLPLGLIALIVKSRVKEEREREMLKSKPARVKSKESRKELKSREADKR